MDRLAVTPTVTLVYIHSQGGTAGEQSQDGSAYIRQHIFNPVMTDDAGTYTCRVTVNTTSGGSYIGQTSDLQIRSN